MFVCFPVRWGNSQFCSFSCGSSNSRLEAQKIENDSISLAFFPPSRLHLVSETRARDEAGIYEIDANKI